MSEQETDQEVTDALTSALGLETTQEPAETPLQVTPNEAGDTSVLDTDNSMAEGTEDDSDADVELPMGVKERAEAIGVDPSFFYDMEYTMNDGSVMTIGDMKDQVQNGGTSEDIKTLKQQQQQLIQERQMLAAQHAIQKDKGEPLEAAKRALSSLTAQYRSINWKEQIDAHGDSAELAKVRMQSQYTQLEQNINNLQSEYDSALSHYTGQVAETQKEAILGIHPDWNDPNTAIAGMQKIHTALQSTGISYDEMINEVSGMGGAVKLAILELAVKGAEGSSFNINEVRKAAKTLSGGRTITAAQQKKMQQGKALQAAKTGSRKQRLAASAQLIADAGGI